MTFISNNLNRISFLFFRYVSALSDPESYLGSKNVPDVCVLIEKASNCVSSETAYDWYDHFKKKCQNWPVVYQTKETAKQLKEAKSTRKEPPATQSKKVSELNLSFKHLFSYLLHRKLLIKFYLVSNFIRKPVNAFSIILSLLFVFSFQTSKSVAVPVTDAKKKQTDDAPGIEPAPLISKNSSGSSSGPGPGSAPDTAQNTVLYRCRFAKAMKDLEKSGIVRLRAGGSVVTRQIYTWISND